MFLSVFLIIACGLDVLRRRSIRRKALRTQRPHHEKRKDAEDNHSEWKNVVH